MFQLTGSNVAAANKDADIAYGIEKQNAASHKTNIERRDVKANYHKVAVASINKTQANIGWAALLANLGAVTDSIDMAQPAYYDKLNEELRSVPIHDWKIYLKASTLKDYAETLSRPFADAAFQFSKVLSGQATQRSRRQVMTDNVDGYLGQ